MKYLQITWLYISIGFLVLYYIIRYGLKGAEKRLDEERKEEIRKTEEVLEGLRLGEDK